MTLPFFQSSLKKALLKRPTGSKFPSAPWDTSVLVKLGNIFLMGLFSLLIFVGLVLPGRSVEIKQDEVER